MHKRNVPPSVTKQFIERAIEYQRERGTALPLPHAEAAEYYGVDLPPDLEINRSIPGGGGRRPGRGSSDVPSLTTRALHGIEPVPVRWLWPGLIPLGKLTDFSGYPGQGKSTIIGADIAARVTTGGAMPDGTASDLPGPAGVLLLSAEDDTKDTIVPRLQAHGADLVRCRMFVLKPDDDSPYPVTLTEDLELIEEAVVRHNIALVVVDPFMAHLGGNVDSHKDQDVRRLLADLKAIAERTGAAIVVVRHFTKKGNGPAMYRAGGSVGIIGAMRAGLIVHPNPEHDGEFVLAPSKMNVGRAGPSLRYRIVSDDVHDVGRIEWLGESPLTADDLLSGGEGEAQPRARNGKSKSREGLKRWMLAFLPGDEISVDELMYVTERLGLSKSTLDRVATEVGVTKRRARDEAGKTTGWYWSLPPRPVPPVDWIELMARANENPDSAEAHLACAPHVFRYDN